MVTPEPVAVAAALITMVVPLVTEAMVALAGMPVPVTYMPETRPEVPPAFSVRPVPVAVALTVSVKLTPGLMLAMLAPAGIPVPLTPMPTTSPVVLAVATTGEAAVVEEVATESGAGSVIVVVEAVEPPVTEIAGAETRPDNVKGATVEAVVSQSKFVPSVKTARPLP